jgi:hypothetical protein
MKRADVQSFKSSFKSLELARPSRFDVLIPMPIVLAAVYGNLRETLSLRCESTEMPGRIFNTTERRFGSAPVQKFPFLSTYNDITMNFILDSDMDLKLFFDQWMEVINPSATYNFRYKNEYVTEIAVNQYDVQNNLTYRAVLIDAFPVAVNQLELDWSSDGYHRLSVVFAYTKWQLGTFSENAKNLGTQALAGFIGSI